MKRYQIAFTFSLPHPKIHYNQKKKKEDKILIVFCIQCNRWYCNSCYKYHYSKYTEHSIIPFLLSALFPIEYKLQLKLLMNSFCPHSLSFIPYNFISLERLFTNISSIEQKFIFNYKSKTTFAHYCLKLNKPYNSYDYCTPNVYAPHRDINQQLYEIILMIFDICQSGFKNCSQLLHLLTTLSFYSFNRSYQCPEQEDLFKIFKGYDLHDFIVQPTIAQSFFRIPKQKFVSLVFPISDKEFAIVLEINMSVLEIIDTNTFISKYKRYFPETIRQVLPLNQSMVVVSFFAYNGVILQRVNGHFELFCNIKLRYYKLIQLKENMIVGCNADFRYDFCKFENKNFIKTDSVASVKEEAKVPKGRAIDLILINDTTVAFFSLYQNIIFWNIETNKQIKAITIPKEFGLFGFVKIKKEQHVVVDCFNYCLLINYCTYQITSIIRRDNNCLYFFYSSHIYSIEKNQYLVQFDGNLMIKRRIPVLTNYSDTCGIVDIKKDYCILHKEGMIFVILLN